MKLEVGDKLLFKPTQYIRTKQELTTHFCFTAVKFEIKHDHIKTN